MTIELYLTYSIVIIGIIVVSVIFRKIYGDYRRTVVIKNFSQYRSVLDYYLEKAYNLLHKDRILVYSLDATTLPDKDFNKISKEFIQLVEKVLGPSLLKEFIFLCGNQETFDFLLLEFFNDRYEGDEIRKTALSNLQEDEIGTPTGEI